MVQRLAARVHRHLASSEPHVLPWRTHVRLITLYISIALLNGLGFAFVTLSVVPVGSHDFLPLIGVFSSASLIGFITITAPAGLGAREAALLYMLQPFLGPSPAVALAIAARIWTTIGDLAFFLLGLIIRLRKHVAPLFTR